MKGILKNEGKKLQIETQSMHEETLSTTETSKLKQILIALGIGLIVIAALGLTKFLQIRKAMSMQFTPPPTAVTSIIAAEVKWPRTLQGVGSLLPSQGVELSTEVSGKIAKINFESGAQVKAGDPLVDLDTSVEEAQLKGVSARLE